MEKQEDNEEIREKVEEAIDLFSRGLALLKEIVEVRNDDNKETPKQIFERFRLKYPGVKRGLDVEYEYFVLKNKDWKQVLPTLLGLVEKQIRQRKQKESLNQWVAEWKNLKTYLGNRGWEESYPTGI